MHKLVDYLCGELEDLERKVEKGSKLSMQELQYADTMAHLKKNLLKAEEMTKGEHAEEHDDSVKHVEGYHVKPDGSYARKDFVSGIDDHTRQALIEIIERM